MKINCSKDDYDLYTIAFPLKVLLNRQKNKYICSQLEKLHPCFSDDCSYDSHFRLEKSGLKADVVVMQKFKVAEYKANKKKLYVQEIKHHQFFADKKKLAVTFVIAALLPVLLSLIFAHARESEQTVTSLPENHLQANENISNKLLLPDFLDYIKSLDAYVKDFSWSYDGMLEQFSVLVYGLYPEQLQDFSTQLKFSSVKYEASIPVMTLTLAHKNEFNASFTYADYTSFRNDLRESLTKQNLLLTEETVNPYGVRFSVPQSSFSNLETLFDFLNQNKICVQSIKITSSDVTNLELIFSDHQFHDHNALFQSLRNNLKLFEFQEPPHATNKTDNSPEKEKPPTQKKSVKTEFIKLQKIGQIIKPDGSVISYYKDEKGKIITR